jgi:hypothetical protein
MTDRDTLTALLAGTPGIGDYAAHQGAGRVIRSGWRPPAQAITDPTEADRLPAGAVVITSAGQVAQRYDGMGGWWQVLDGDPIDSSAELIGTGSIEVLRIPTENGDAE